MNTDFLMCGERGYPLFKNNLVGRVLGCRVPQQLVEQNSAVHKKFFVTCDKSDVHYELYVTLNLKRIYENIRRDLCLRRMFNTPFLLMFKSMTAATDKNPSPVLQL